MTNYRLANSTAKKLKQIDTLIEERIDKWKSDTPTLDIDPLEQKGVEILREAAQRLNLIRVGVADGEAFYFEIKRTKTMVTFQWFYGGPDNYVDEWGEIVAIPIKQADKLILRPKDIR